MTGVVWQCPCGAYNQMGRYVCHACAKNFSINLARTLSPAESAREPGSRAIAAKEGATPSALEPSDSRPSRRVFFVPTRLIGQGLAQRAARCGCSRIAVFATGGRQ